MTMRTSAAKATWPGAQRTELPTRPAGPPAAAEPAPVDGLLAPPPIRHVGLWQPSVEFIPIPTLAAVRPSLERSSSAPTSAAVPAARRSRRVRRVPQAVRARGSARSGRCWPSVTQRLDVDPRAVPTGKRHTYRHAIPPRSGIVGRRSATGQRCRLVAVSVAAARDRVTCQTSRPSHEGTARNMVTWKRERNRVIVSLRQPWLSGGCSDAERLRIDGSMTVYREGD